MLREKMLSHTAQKYGLPLVVVYQVGGNDDPTFDGRSSAFDAQGRLFARAKGFQEDLVIADIATSTGAIAEDDFTPEAEIWNAGAGRPRLRAQDAFPAGAAGSFRRH